MAQIEILLVDDSPEDIDLTRIALNEGKIAGKLHMANDGVEAMAFLNDKAKGKSPLPDLILLDLNMPRKDGRETLEEIKTNDKFKHIPVIVLTTSISEEDIIESYRHHANCFVTKPVNFDSFEEIIRSIEYFWFSTVKLPSKK